jgi:AcrR family transcriptional regulator
MGRGSDPYRRDALLTAALKGFTQRGYNGTTVAELAAATGMSKAAVSYHFPTKNDLLHALADPPLDGLDALVERHPQARPHGPTACARCSTTTPPPEPNVARSPHGSTATRPF